MASEMSCKFLVILLIMMTFKNCLVISDVQTVQHQTHHKQSQSQPQSQPQSQSQSQLATAGTRWSRRPQTHTTTATACDYKELLNNLHDRVSILVTLDEDERTRLEGISKRITQLAENSLGRLDSLAAGQVDFLKRLESFELVQRITKRELEDLRSALAANFTTKHEKTESTILGDLNNDLSGNRHIRDVPEHRSVEDLSESEKLDALSTLLVSTRAALNTLQVTLEGDVSRLLQETNRLNRRFANLQRRQQQQFQQPHPGVVSYIPQQSTTYARPLITSCSQGVPTSHNILRLQITENSEPFYVRCDEDYMNGGWTIIQNRYTGDLNFQRDWNEYKTGFGNLASEFFIGLDKLHAITSNAVQELVIVLEDFQGDQRYAKYNLFAIGNEAEFYALKLLGDYEGDAGDALSYHAGSKFSTFDNDNDGCVDCNCAQAHMGAWWYNWCEMSNLNGKYYKENETVSRYTGMYWHNFHGPNVSLRAARMMIRPVVEQETRR